MTDLHGTEVAGSTFELVELAPRRLLIDRDTRSYAELPSGHEVEPHGCGYDWTPYLDIERDDATGDLVIHVTATRLVRLCH
jgi:hypothetical protein